MEARQLSKALGTQAALQAPRLTALIGLALVSLGVMAMPAQAQTKLKLPQTPEQYRELAEDVATPTPGGRKGTVQRVGSEKVAVPTEAPEPNQTLQTVPGKTEVAPAQISLNAKGKTEAPPSARQYRVVVRWEDGSYGEVLVKDNPHLRAGDLVSVDEGKITRLPRSSKH